MISENIKSDRTFDRIGLPPMELAESANERSSRCLYRCIYPTLQKLIVMLILITFSAGLYVLILKLLNTTENTQNTEIILVTGKDTHNITLHQNEWKIWLQMKNESDTKMKRKKREILHGKMKNKLLERHREDERVKEIIIKHNTLCHDQKHKIVCDQLLSKLNSIINNNEETENIEKQIPQIKNVRIDSDHFHLSPTDISKRETNSLDEMKTHRSLPIDNHHQQYVAPRHLPDTCLLAKLLQQRFPQAKEVYDPVSQDPTAPHMRYFHSYMPSYAQSRENEDIPKLHPQDFNIFMNFFNKLEHLPNAETKKSSRAIECPVGSLPCDNNEDCIEENQWCDGNIDCADASDEIRCSCKSRVDKSRLCDGYFDCPLGEDEMGCYGCSSNTYSCGNSKNSCFTKEQRCNGDNDCPNNRDEIECNMLSPNLDRKLLFAISNTEGYLHRNFKGDWFPVCQNPYMWAHDVCRREAGLIIRPPLIQIVPIDPILRVNYMNNGPGGLMQMSDSCFNSSAVYVTCPDLLCGTRVLSSSQLLHENLEAENQLFGRNKRFLYPSFEPYYIRYYGKRMKREASATRTIINTDNDAKLVSVETSDLMNNSSDDNRNKRAEERVVGGKPSQPAAWPWMVAIYRDGMFHCGGVIMTQTWVVSAAHCLHKFWDHYYEVQVGMLRRFSFSPQEQNHRVSYVIVNHQYNQLDMKSDLSLLKVEQAIQFSRWVRPICLPGPNTAGPDWQNGPAPGTVCTAVGWGATIEHGPDPDHLREVELPIWEKCKHPEDRAGKEICAGFVEGGKDACQGDSGGPLLCRNPLNSQQWFLAGIVSHGDGCARKDEPGVYTRVSLFVKWIRYHISSKSLPRLRPKQECPGFKCLSGISKCLPNIRKCDKIVDCLDADDETNCEFMRATDEFVTKKVNVTNTHKRSDKSSREVETELLSNNKTDLNTEIVTEKLINSIITITTDVSTTRDNKIEINETNLEISTTTLSDVVNIDEEENVTNDPLSSDSSSNIFAVSFNPWTLESRSILSENSDNNLRIETSTIAQVDDFLTTETIALSSASEKSNIMISTTQTSRGDNVSDDISTETNVLKDLNPVLKNNQLSVNTKNDSENLIIELLPQINSSQLDSTPVDDKNVLNNFQGSENNDNLRPKILPDAENKDEITQKIEDIVFSELQPATLKRKPRVPKDFKCQKIFQLIPYNRRCDRKADCEDGTDELDCSCFDYLLTYNEKLICDGIFDCANGEDENNCYTCPENYFLCRESEICLPIKYVCDDKAQCPMGEDEMNCFALSNGKEMFYDIDEKPKITLEGFLTKRKKDDWQVMCEDQLSIEQQEESAAHICRYLGFSSANRYFVKYINVRNEDVVRSGLDEHLRRKRGAQSSVPIHFTFTDFNTENRTARNIVIKEPQVLKEECVPNVTKTCKSLYVFCDAALYTNFEVGQNFVYNRAAESTSKVKTSIGWPWIAKVYVEGDYKCTGILIDLAWVLVTDSCLWDTSTTQNFITVILGSYRTLDHINGMYEQIRKVDAMKDLYKNRVVMLHLKEPAKYTNMVKPMTVSSPSFDKNNTCVAIGQDLNNNTVTLFLNESTRDCKLSNRCFIRNTNDKICPIGAETHRNWSGLISCHGEQGWYPAASFVDSRGECGIGDHIVATDIENLRHEIKYYSGFRKGVIGISWKVPRSVPSALAPLYLSVLQNCGTLSQGPCFPIGKVLISESTEDTFSDRCDGVRCGRGKCVSLRDMCDHVHHCEDGKDESAIACENKRFLCSKDPFQYGCECTSSQMKCKNGKCISKTLFRNGEDNCEDGSDEPLMTRCSDYLAAVMPSKLCDGTLHCHDRSDENPMFCKCFAKQAYKCVSSKEDYCVASDMVCDGVRDCPNGDDERSCIALSAPEGTPYGTGQVIVRSHGVWHVKCYPTQNHTISELEAICRDLGFLSGHAKQIKDEKYHINPHNNFILEPFRDVVLNNKTVIKMRNANIPVVKAIFDADLKNCFPVVVECL